MGQFDIEDKHEDTDVEIKCEFYNPESELSEIKKIYTSGGSVSYSNENNYPEVDDLFVTSSRRYWRTYTGTHNQTKQNYKSSLIEQDRSTIDSSFVNRIFDIVQNKDLKSEYDQLLKQVMPDLSDWNIQLSRGQNYIEYKTGSGEKHSSELLGDGVISLFKVIVPFVHKEDEEKELIIIDEPELSFHPQLKRRLADFLSEKSKEYQIIISTHSPHFISWSDIKNGAKVIRLSKVDDKFTETHTLSEDTICELDNVVTNWAAPFLLDEVAKEVFFADKVFFTEGQEDVGLIKKFILEKDINTNFDIFGYGANGAGNIPKFLQMAGDLDVIAGGLFDGDKKSEAEFPGSDNYYIKVHSKDDIRDKANKNKTGLFDKEGNIKDECEEELKGIIKEFNKLKN